MTWWNDPRPAMQLRVLPIGGIAEIGLLLRPNARAGFCRQRRGATLRPGQSGMLDAARTARAMASPTRSAASEPSAVRGDIRALHASRWRSRRADRRRRSCGTARIRPSRAAVGHHRELGQCVSLNATLVATTASVVLRNAASSRAGAGAAGSDDRAHHVDAVGEAVRRRRAPRRSGRSASRGCRRPR